MIITNKYNIPKELVTLLTPKERDIIPFRYSVSTLTGAPLVRALTVLHKDAIEVDVSENLWMLMGTMMHDAIYNKSEKDEGKIQEEKIEIPIDTPQGIVTISGIPDLYKNRVITDWKMTSVFSYIYGKQEPHGVKESWYEQLNVYGWMIRKLGYPVDAIRNYAVLRDWVKTRSYDSDYPPIPFVEMPVPLMSFEEADMYVSERIKIHSEIEKALLKGMVIEDVPPCTAKERMERKGEWKIFHPDLKRSMANHDTKEKAVEWVKQKTEIEKGKGKKGRNMEKVKITFVPGESINCTTYCNVKQFCPYRDQFINSKTEDANENET